MTSQYDISNQNARKIIVFDTTLRDGEQSPGASMNLNEKVQVAQALVELGVDVIEAGFRLGSRNRESRARLLCLRTCALRR